MQLVYSEDGFSGKHKWNNREESMTCCEELKV